MIFNRKSGKIGQSSKILLSWFNNSFFLKCSESHFLSRWILRKLAFSVFSVFFWWNIKIAPVMFYDKSKKIYPKRCLLFIEKMRKIAKILAFFQVAVMGLNKYSKFFNDWHYADLQFQGRIHIKLLSFKIN